MTSTELDQYNGTLEVLPPKQPPSANAQRMLVAHAEMMQTAWELATKMTNTTMVPARFFHKPEDATAAILYGAELGLNPIQSLQQVFPVHGSPSIYARTMAALLKARGYQFKTVENTIEAVEVHGWEPGRSKDDEPDEKARWTIEDAARAGYTKNQKYDTDPRAMLYAKALAEVCRHMAPDVLLGISYSTEELQLEPVEAPRPAANEAAAAPITVEEILGTEPTTDAEAAPMPDPADPTPQREDPPAQPQPQEPDPGQDDGNDQSQGAESSAGAPPLPDSGDQDPPVAAKEKSKIRLALERRLFKLLAKGDVDNDNREDRLTIYTEILKGNDRGEPITTTDDLDDVEVGTICDQLFTWDKNGELGQKITDILNSATLAEANAEAAQPEGEK